MAAVGRFESRPRIAVGVSGGADSLALALLLKDWTDAAGGELMALIVDHGLRPESGAEADRVGEWLDRRGVAHRVLRWIGPKPRRGIQAAARDARYRLMTECCRESGVLHLALAHHRDDQAETVLMRLAGGSGLDGLAGMAAVSELAAVRLVRPLLDTAKVDLVATLDARGQEWLEDPSNRDRRYLRARLRALRPELDRAGLTPARLAATALRMGRARAVREAETAALLAATAAVHPEGYIRLEPERLTRAPAEVGLRALGRCLMTVGGGAYPPRRGRLERLLTAIRDDPAHPGRTLAGCRLLPWDGGLLLCREPAAAGDEIPLSDRQTVLWDGRFLIPPATAWALPPGQATVARLGGAGWHALRAADPAVARHPVPAPVRPSLPALFDRDGILAVPHLGYGRRHGGAYTAVAIPFAPRNPLAPATFVVAPERFDIIF